MKKESTEEILDTGSVIAQRDGRGIHCLTVIGQVEGHYLLGDGQKVTKYEHLIPLLVSVEESEEIDGLLLILNTMGGDVEAGLALAEMISSMKKPTVSLVLGGGHSIGVPLAVCTDESFIVPTATMTVHPVRISGLVLGVPQSFEAMKRMQDRILTFVVEHSKAKKATLQKLIGKTDEMTTDIGTVVDGNAAVEMGLIDAVGGLGEALAALKEMIAQRKK
jgi:ATP-dependent protease ClpP protease subunit